MFDKVKSPVETHEIHLRLPSLLCYFFRKDHSETTWSCHVQSSFATITRHLDNGIWNDTLQLKILRTWITIWTNFFLSKYFKKESAKVPGLIYHLHNNPSLLFEEHCAKTFHLLLIISEMSCCNVLLRAGSNINFIFCCSDNFCYSLFTFLLYDILCVL